MKYKCYTKIEQTCRSYEFFHINKYMMSETFVLKAIVLSLPTYKKIDKKKQRVNAPLLSKL